MAIDKKISELASGAPAQAADLYVVARGAANYKLTLTNIAASMPPIGATTPNTGAFTTLSSSAGANFATSSGNVGVGTASPGDKLDIAANYGNVGPTTGTQQAAWKVTNTGGNLYVGIDNSTGGTFNTGTAYAGVLWRSGAYPICFVNNSTERMRLDSSGNLLIKTATAEFNNANRGLIEVNGASSSAVVLKVADSGSGYMYHGGTDFLLNNIKNGAMTFSTNNTERARIDSSGNFGVGVTTVNAKIEARNGYIRSYHNSASINAGYGYEFSTDGGGTDTTIALISALQETASARTGAILFQTSNAGAPAERARISSAGNFIALSAGTAISGAPTGSSHRFATNLTQYAGVYISDPAFSGAQNQVALGLTCWTGSGANYYTSKITSLADGALTFGTQATVSADGAGTVTERARITAAGQFIVNGTSASDGKIAAFKYNNVDDGAAIYGYQGNAAYPGVGTTRYGVRGACHGYSSVANVGVYGYSVDDSVSNTKLYGVWGETGEIVYNTGYGVYGKSVLYTATSGTVYGVYGTVSTTQNDTTAGTTHAGYFYNASTKGGTAYGATVETVSGPGTVIPFRIIHAGGELLRVNSGGELLIGTGDNGAYLLQVNSQIWATNATIATSDSRLKDNVTPITNALDTINKVRAVTFDFKQDTKYNLDKERQTGFIAQELRDALDNADYKNCVVKECGDYYGVAYEKMIPVLVAAIQEQQAMIKSLEAKIAALESK